MSVRRVFLALLFVFVFAGCGADGDDGQSFIAVDWVGTPIYYDDTNPAIPQVFYPGQYYSAVVGNFSFLYEAWDASVWSGSYTISINSGEDGGFFPWDDGESGTDRYFTLWLLSNGPFLDDSGSLAPPVEAEKAIVGIPDERRTIQRGQLPARLLNAAHASSRSTQELQVGMYNIRLEYYRCDPATPEMP